MKTIEDIRPELGRLLDYHASQTEKCMFLEAGCGSGSNVKLPDNAYITGIDISQEQLDRNALLDKKIKGDLQTYRFDRGKFDVVICWDVLEHLDHPEFAIKNMFEACRIGGLVIIAMPDVLSVKGLFTKFTPHSIHVFVYRDIYGNKNAGRPGNPPFKTFLRLSASVRSIKKQAKERGLDVVFYESYESGMQRELRKKLYLSEKLIEGGRLDS